MHATFDAHSLILDGNRSLFLSGAIHYSRSTPLMWPELMRQSKAAGLNIVETVVFWNQHERIRGQYDFTGRFDLARFCRTAAEHGLKVFLRPGPYVCAEQDFGGFPAWLRDIPGIRLRTENAAYYREVKRWFDLLFDHLRPLFCDRGGPIIAVQVENEYANIAQAYGEAGAAYLGWLRELIKGYGIDVPLTSCNPAGDDQMMAALQPLAGTTPTLNSGFAHPFVRAFRRWAPESPCLWTEAWASWYQIWGAPRPHRPATDIAYCAARFFAEGGKGINYYMWHGGTNFGRDAMFLQVTSYDYDAPLDEYGMPAAKFFLLGELHHALLAHQEFLLQNDLPEQRIISPVVSILSYRRGETSLHFLCNDAPLGSLPCTIECEGRDWLLAPRSVWIVKDGGLVWKVVVTPEKDLPRRKMRPLPIPLTSVQFREETFPVFTEPALTHPREQLEVTFNRSDYAWYGVEFPAEIDFGPGILRLTGINDFFQVFVDGRRVAGSKSHCQEDRGPWLGSDYQESFDLVLPQRSREMTLLTAALGLVKGDWQAGHANMVQERKGFWGAATWTTPSRVTELKPWRRLGGLMSEQPLAGFQPSALTEWQARPESERNRPLRWFKFEFDGLSPSTPVAFDFSTLGKGIAWLNDRCLGRFWSISAKIPQVVHTEHNQVMAFDDEGGISQTYYHAPIEWLRGDRNTLIIFEEIGGDPSGVRLCEWTQDPRST